MGLLECLPCPTPPFPLEIVLVRGATTAEVLALPLLLAATAAELCGKLRGARPFCEDEVLAARLDDDSD